MWSFTVVMGNPLRQHRPHMAFVERNHPIETLAPGRPNEEPVDAIQRKTVPKLLDRPFRGGVVGEIPVHDPACPDVEDDEDVQSLKGGGHHDEEVAGQRKRFSAASCVRSRTISRSMRNRSARRASAVRSTCADDTVCNRLLSGCLSVKGRRHYFLRRTTTANNRSVTHIEREYPERSLVELCEGGGIVSIGSCPERT